MHYTTQRFWKCYDALPESVQETANQCYELLKADPSHPSLHFNKLGKKYWSVRVGLDYRALGVEVYGWNLKPKICNFLLRKLLQIR
ncbi:hypothetical protein ACF3DV_12075 [Chlorogloeopsis fritschii PCC 9212]|uniref:hypothetical protein n=1 Tax=Chlorogloeopsis fritschii TaxID=1124 RepID=UPI0008FBE92A|nr:hypothetical protein [Chlorogloeopsis fritschii]